MLSKNANYLCADYHRVEWFIVVIVSLTAIRLSAPCIHVYVSEC